MGVSFGANSKSGSVVNLTYTKTHYARNLYLAHLGPTIAFGSRGRAMVQHTPNHQGRTVDLACVSSVCGLCAHGWMRHCVGCVVCCAVSGLFQGTLCMERYERMLFWFVFVRTICPLASTKQASLQYAVYLTECEKHQCRVAQPQTGPWGQDHKTPPLTHRVRESCVLDTI